ncbi:MAG: hypothetical protein ACK419_05555 [Pyrinomonadaceae bacterium]
MNQIIKQQEIEVGTLKKTVEHCQQEIQRINAQQETLNEFHSQQIKLLEHQLREKREEDKREIIEHNERRRQEIRVSMKCVFLLTFPDSKG